MTHGPVNNCQHDWIIINLNFTGYKIIKCQVCGEQRKQKLK